MLPSIEQELWRFRSWLSYCENEINKINDVIKELREENKTLKAEIIALKSNFLLSKRNSKDVKWKKTK